MRFETDVSGLHICTIFKGQASKKKLILGHLTLDYGRDMIPKRRFNTILGRVITQKTENSVQKRRKAPTTQLFLCWNTPHSSVDIDRKQRGL